jgi:hypothetical protein
MQIWLNDVTICILYTYFYGWFFELSSTFTCSNINFYGARNFLYVSECASLEIKQADACSRIQVRRPVAHFYRPCSFSHYCIFFLFSFFIFLFIVSWQPWKCQRDGAQAATLYVRGQFHREIKRGGRCERKKRKVVHISAGNFQRLMKCDNVPHHHVFMNATITEYSAALSIKECIAYICTRIHVQEFSTVIYNEHLYYYVVFNTFSYRYVYRTPLL